MEKKKRKRIKRFSPAEYHVELCDVWAEVREMPEEQLQGLTRQEYMMLLTNEPNSYRRHDTGEICWTGGAVGAVSPRGMGFG